MPLVFISILDIVVVVAVLLIFHQNSLNGLFVFKSLLVFVEHSLFFIKFPSQLEEDGYHVTANTEHSVLRYKEYDSE